MNYDLYIINIIIILHLSFAIIHIFNKLKKDLKNSLYKKILLLTLIILSIIIYYFLKI